MIRKTEVPGRFTLSSQWRGTMNVDRLFVVEMGPEDLHEVETLDWASPASKSIARDHFNGFVNEGGSGGHFWGHIKGLAHLKRTINDGWSDGVAKIAKLAEQIDGKIPAPYGPRRRLQWGAQGDEIEMPKVYGGQLDQAWRSMPRQRGVAPRVISIDVNVGHNAYVNAEELFWAGAAGLVLTDALEQAGYRVELFATSVTYTDEAKAASMFRLVAKRASDPASMATLASLACLPATFRFYHIHGWTAAPWNIGWGHGHATEIGPALEQAVRKNAIEGSEFTLNGVLSEKAALEEITRILKVIEDEQFAGQGVML